MNKKIRKIMSLALALMLCASMTMGVLAETVEGVVNIETTAGNSETVYVDVTIEKTNNADGSITYESTGSAESFKTESGMTVDCEVENKETVAADGDYTADGKLTYTATDASGDYVAEGGKEYTVGPEAPEVTVDVPLTDTDDPETEEIENQNTVAGPEAGTTTVTEGEKPENNEGTYDYTEELVVEQGSATVTTTEVTITDNVKPDASDLEHVASEVDPDDDNDLIRDKTSNTGVIMPTEGNEPTAAEGYEYVFIGSGNSSQFWTCYLKKTPSKEGETPVYSYVDENGKTVNLYAGSKAQKVDTLYVDGEKVELDNAVKVNRSGTFQFVMYNPETKEISTTYCADLVTGATKNFSYNIENLEDAEYYSDEEAAMIRSVALNGYWGTKDDPDTEEAEFGSLEAVREMMREAKDEDGNAIFTEEEISGLTDGMALSATQFAIWTFSNKMNQIEFINTMYSTGDANHVLNGYWNNVPEEEEYKVEVIFKLYEVLVGMDPTPLAEEEATTANTIINSGNFVSDLSVTVIEKAEGHENNKNESKEDDAYVTDLTFALVVTPSTKNGDDLVVKVIDAKGNEIASGRIAGELQEGEKMIYADEEGNYTFSGITLIEGEQNFNITLDGIQNLEEGVYLYTSEVKNGASSQTMVGIAGGEHAVNVEMNIKFEFSVDDEIVATERVYRTERRRPNTPGTPGTPGDPGTPEDPTPGTRVPRTGTGGGNDEIEIIDEEVPLAAAPETGDGSLVYAIMAIASAMGIAALQLSKKRERA